MKFYIANAKGAHSSVGILPVYCRPVEWREFIMGGIHKGVDCKGGSNVMCRKQAIDAEDFLSDVPSSVILFLVSNKSLIAKTIAKSTFYYCLTR